MPQRLIVLTFDDIRLRYWFGVSRRKGLNRSCVLLPICPHCGAGNGASSPNFSGNFTIALLPQMTGPCQ